jgi:hypothetical protein
VESTTLASHNSRKPAKSGLFVVRTGARDRVKAFRSSDYSFSSTFAQKRLFFFNFEKIFKAQFMIFLYGREA